MFASHEVLKFYGANTHANTCIGLSHEKDTNNNSSST